MFLDPEDLPEDRRWNVDDVAGGLVDKMVRRNPHVFAGLGSGEGFPPTLVVVCELDGLRPSGEAFAALQGA